MSVYPFAPAQLKLFLDDCNLQWPKYHPHVGLTALPSVEKAVAYETQAKAFTTKLKPVSVVG